MKRSSLYCILLSVIGCVYSNPCFPGEGDPNDAGTIEILYPNLAAGVLTQAKVGELPEGILLQAEELEISRKDIDQIISQQPKRLRQDLKKDMFFLLEQEAAARLLPVIARRELGEKTQDVTSIQESKLIDIFFDNLTDGISVSDRDIETFYQENESVFCGTPLDKVRKQIESYVLQDKKRRVTDQFIRNLGQRVEIVVSNSWLETQAKAAGDNPLDKARGNGKQTLAVFSAKSCCGPDKMQPVINAVRKKYDDKINIVYIEPRREQVLASRYGVRSVPTVIFYTDAGREFYRHSGFVSEQNIVEKMSRSLSK